MARVITASFLSREEAEDATERLMAAGLTRREISVLAPEENGGSHVFSLEPRRTFLAGVGGGALLGMLVGAVCGALLALLPVAVPELERLGLDFAAVGPVVSALMGAGAGAAVLGLLGGLFGLRRTEHEAVLRDGDRVGAGSYVLVGVAAPPEMMRSAVHLLANTGAHKIVRG
jgi:hypothetical protein